jgi:hypothetical protein
MRTSFSSEVLRGFFSDLKTRKLHAKNRRRVEREE